MNFYISPGAAFLLVIFYMPLALYLVLRVWRDSKLSQKKRTGILIGGLLVAAAIPLWDVTITSVQMATLCQKAGVFVNHSVKVDGFLTNFPGRPLLDRGFQFIEQREDDGRYVIYTRQDGAVGKQNLNAKTYQPKSRYEFLHDIESGALPNALNIGVHKSIVRDRMTGGELGHTLAYTAFPGWVDRQTISRISQLAWTCNAHFGQDIVLLNQVLIPN